MAETTKGNGQLHSDVGINISVPLDWVFFLDQFESPVAVLHHPARRPLLVY